MYKKQWTSFEEKSYKKVWSLEEEVEEKERRTKDKTRTRRQQNLKFFGQYLSHVWRGSYGFCSYIGRNFRYLRKAKFRDQKTTYNLVFQEGRRKLRKGVRSPKIAYLSHTCDVAAVEEGPKSCRLATNAEIVIRGRTCRKLLGSKLLKLLEGQNLLLIYKEGWLGLGGVFVFGLKVLEFVIWTSYKKRRISGGFSSLGEVLALASSLHFVSTCSIWSSCFGSCLMIRTQ